MSTVQDPATNLLLDFIAGGVTANPGGESAGNYNAVIGNTHATDDLGQKTFIEIYALQDQLRAAGRPSSAIGRYQFIKTTLQSLQEKAQFPDDTKFTSAVQDQLAVMLLVRRGYSSWWKGRIDNETFAHNLSLEWASLPDPDNGGKSHYDGVGPNHASTSLSAVYAMLGQVRGLIPGAVDAASKASQPVSDDTSADELNRHELRQLLAESVPSTAVLESTPPPARMAPGVALGYAGLGVSAVAGSLQFLWPLLHGQLPPAPNELQATNLAGLLIGGSTAAQHIIRSWLSRRS